jgi:two-component system alkaline phosphatase synthesis response regulator PhoP
METLTNKDKSNIHILLVDDEQDILEFLKYNLEREGYKIHTAKNGLQAVEIFQSVRPSLIIMDVMMPVMDGFQLLKELKELMDSLVP